MMRLFNRITKINVHGDVDVSVYRSVRSKLRVAIASVPGPMVKGKISFGKCLYTFSQINNVSCVFEEVCSYFIH